MSCNNTLFRRVLRSLVAHDCGYPLSRYTCRATRVVAYFLDLLAFCRCSTGVALRPLTILVSHLSPSLCREVSHRNLGLKGVALHGCVAATVAGVALHCPTRLRRFYNSKCFLEGFLEGVSKGFSKDKFLRRVLRRERFIEGALRRCLEGRNTSFRRVRPPSRAPYFLGKKKLGKGMRRSTFQ